MTHTVSFHGSLCLYWNVVYSEYRRLGAILGVPPFVFEIPNPKTTNLDEYTPKNWDTITITFRDQEHKRELLTVEAELLPDEDKEIKSALKKAGRRSSSLKHQRRKKRGMHQSTLIAINRLYEIHAEASKKKTIIISRKDAAGQVGIALNTWRNNDRELWDYWENKSYRNQNMQ